MDEMPNDTIVPLRLIEPASLGKLVLRGTPESIGPAAASLGVDLPAAINTAADGSAGRVIRLGPDEHLLLAEAGRTPELVRSLAEALRDRHHALVDLSARLVAVELLGNPLGAAPAGPSGSARGSEPREQAASASRTPARDTLSAACPLDLDPAAFAPGQATRTVLGKAEIVLDCLDNDHFRLLTNRSFADYVRRLLQEAGREFGLQRDTAA
jgi:sarcosine oxidase subunit gamma